jgi:S-adenosylhomocysteine hydrolase
VDKRVMRIALDYDWSASHQIADALPLLDELRERSRVNLRGWRVLMIQHHLATFIPLVDALVEDGMDPASSWHVDIPYSTHRPSNDVLRERWSRFTALPPLFEDPLSDYSESQLLRVAFQLEAVAGSGHHRPLLVVDDGAYFVRALLALSKVGRLQPEDLGRIVIVEQTMRGERFLRIHNDDLLVRNAISAVSIARSVVKRTVEAPCVGAAVAAAIGRDAQTRKNIAVLGYGVVGEATTVALKEGYPSADLAVIERDPEAAGRAGSRSEGKWPVRRRLDHDGGYDLIVGCTGSTAFTVEDRHLLADGALLASASSAAIEFDRDAFVELADAYPEHEVAIIGRKGIAVSGIHAAIPFRLEGGRTATFLNAGFPVNFDGRSHSLPVKMIQGTRSAIYAAISQAVVTSEVGLQGLRVSSDRWIARRALDLLLEP